jgi:hypothetical protein
MRGVRYDAQLQVNVKNGVRIEASKSKDEISVFTSVNLSSILFVPCLCVFG